MEFRVLGPLEVNVPTGLLPLGSGRRLRTLLAMFLAQPNRVLSSDALIESLWSDNPPPSAATALRVHLTAASVASRTGSRSGRAERPARHRGRGLPASGRARRARLAPVRAAGAVRAACGIALGRRRRVRRGRFVVARPGVRRSRRHRSRPSRSRSAPRAARRARSRRASTSVSRSASTRRSSV